MTYLSVPLDNAWQKVVKLWLTKVFLSSMTVDVNVRPSHIWWNNIINKLSLIWCSIFRYLLMWWKLCWTNAHKLIKSSKYVYVLYICIMHVTNTTNFTWNRSTIVILWDVDYTKWNYWTWPAHHSSYDYNVTFFLMFAEKNMRLNKIMWGTDKQKEREKVKFQPLQ